MTDKQNLLNRLSAAQFSMWEVHMYLDTHPNDSAALSAYKTYKERYSELLNEYNSKYNGIEADSNNNTKWEWVNSPWPWEEGLDK